MVGDDANVGIDDGDVFAGMLVDEMDAASSEVSVMVTIVRNKGGSRVEITNLPRSDCDSNFEVGRCSSVQNMVSCISLSKVSRNDIICDEIY